MQITSKAIFPGINLSEKAKKIIFEDAQKTYPHECCGFFFGKQIEGRRQITEVLVVDNSVQENRARRFEITALDYMRAERKAIEEDLDLLGVYHSHPDHPAIPSSHDLAVALPFFSYVIVSVQKGEVNHWRSWQLDEGGLFAEEKERHNK